MIQAKFYKLRLISCITLGLSLAACGNDSNKELSIPIDEPLAGVWQAPAYGLVLDIQADTHQFYQVTSDFCQRFELGLDHEELISNTQLSADSGSIITMLSGTKDPGMVMEKEISLPAVCMNGLTANNGESNYQFDAQRDFEIFWQTFSQYYAFFDIEDVDWNEVFQIADSKIGSQTTESELIQIMIEMVEPLQDFHVRILNDQLDISFSVFRKPSLIDLAVQDYLIVEELTLPFNQAQVDMFNIYFDDAIDKSFQAIASYLETDTDFEENANENIVWGKFDNNIGYLNLITMDLEDFGDSNSNFEQNKAMLAETLDEVMQYFADVDGIIIDVRFLGRGTGDDLVSTMIASRFVNQSLHAYSKQARLGDSRTPLQQVTIEPLGSTQFLGPIALMTSETTSGAGEIFAISMRQRPNTALIGEATAGGFSNSLVKSLPHGTQYSLSNEFYLTPDNEEFEGVGVPVDIGQAFFTLEQRELGIDLGLEKAEAWIIQQQ